MGIYDYIQSQLRKLQWLGLHSLQRQRLWSDLITAFKIFTGLLDIDLNFFSSLPLDAALEGTSTRYSKVRAGM